MEAFPRVPGPSGEASASRVINSTVRFRSAASEQPAPCPVRPNGRIITLPLPDIGERQMDRYLPVCFVIGVSLAAGVIAAVVEEHLPVIRPYAVPIFTMLALVGVFGGFFAIAWWQQRRGRKAPPGIS
jgi:hypothetical protein